MSARPRKMALVMDPRKEYRQAAVIFALMILIFFWPLFKGRILSQADTLYFFPPWSDSKPSSLTVPSNAVLDDQTRQFLTFFQVARESFQRMEFPLWNPYIMAGTPLLANSLSALLFPLNWPFYFLPLFLGFTVSALPKMFIASMGTYAFSRRLSLSHLSAILAGTTYTFSIFNVFWLNHPQTNATIFFPILLFLAEKVRDDPSPSAMAVLGLTVGVQLLGGHVEISFLIALGVTLFFFFRLFDYRKDWKALFLRLKIFVGGYTLGFFLAGLLTIPVLEFLTQSATWKVRSEKSPFFLESISFISIFLSDFFTRKGWASDLILYHALSLYIGICPLIFVVVNSAYRVHKRILIFFGGLSLFAIAIAFGLPPFFPLLTSLPVFKQTPNFYMIIFYILGMSLIGATGMDFILTAPRNDELRRKVKRVLILTGLISPLLVFGLIFLAMKTSPLSLVLKGLKESAVSPWNFIFSQIGENLARNIIFAGLGYVLIVAAFRIQRFKNLVGLFAIGVTFADLFIAGSGWNPAIPIRWAQPSLPPAALFLKGEQDLYRICGISPVMAPNLATLCGLQDVRGYDVIVEDRYHVFFQKALRGKTAWWIYDFPNLEIEALPFLSLLNVKYFMSLSPLPPPLTLVYDKEVKVYKNPDAFSRAFLVHQVEAVKNGLEALERVMALGPDLKRVAVLEGSLPEALLTLDSKRREKETADRIQMITYAARQVEIEVETLSPGLLVLADTYFPGWKAEINGKETPVFRANYLLKGIAVGSGKHRVRFFYCPSSFYIGFGLTVIAGVIILWGLKRKRKNLVVGSR